MGLPPLSIEEAEAIHLHVMEEYPEEPSGILDRGLLASVLLRPTHAAISEGADGYHQAATLLWGLIRSHAFIQGNRRTATAIAFFFLERAGYTVEATDDEVLELVYQVEAGPLRLERVTEWFRAHARRPP